MTLTVGQRVKSVFDDSREGVVVESRPEKLLIEFEDYDEDERKPFTHQKWLPARDWEAA